MQQITLTIDLTTENLELLKRLCPKNKSQKAAPQSSSETSKPQTVEEQAKTPQESDNPEQKSLKAVSLTDVRALALKLSKAGKQDALKEAFAKFGGKKLSDIKEENYAELMQVLSEEVSGNA